MAVKITFDLAKGQAALNGRGLNFADAEIVFAGRTITVQDTRRDYGEARHVMSMRKCNDREKAIYQEQFGQG
jgi:uncharacterized DUF497 family protein